MNNQTTNPKENKSANGNFCHTIGTASKFLDDYIEFIYCKDPKFIEKFENQTKKLEKIKQKLSYEEVEKINEVVYELLELHIEAITNCPFIEIRLSNYGGK